MSATTRTVAAATAAAATAAAAAPSTRSSAAKAAAAVSKGPKGPKGTAARKTAAVRDAHPLQLQRDAAVAAATAFATAENDASSFASLFRTSRLATITYPLRSTDADSAPAYAAAGTSIPRPLAPAFALRPSHQRQQILTAPASARQRGEWGLKHTLPGDWRPSVVAVSAIDDGDRRIAVYRSAVADVADAARWGAVFAGVGAREVPALQARAFAVEAREAAARAAEAEAHAAGGKDRAAPAMGTASMFAPRVVVAGRTGSRPVVGDLSRVSLGEWRAMLRRAMALGQRWRAARRAVIDARENPQLPLLGARRGAGGPQAPAASVTGLPTLKVDDLLFQHFGVRSRREEKRDGVIHPMFYRTQHGELRAESSTGPKPVIGRLLSRLGPDGFAVGIYGYVAYLPRNEAIMDDSASANVTVRGVGSVRDLIRDVKSTNTLLEDALKEKGRREIKVWIVAAEHDEAGRPVVIVSMREPQRGGSLLVSSSSSSSTLSRTVGRSPTAAAAVPPKAGRAGVTLSSLPSGGRSSSAGGQPFASARDLDV